MNFLEALLWLTLNVYHEARSEPVIGQKAVAHVTLNRASRRHQSVREVVTAPKQFSWTVTRRSYAPDDIQAFVRCMYPAVSALFTEDFTNGATHYHRLDVHPYWASKMTYLTQYGKHKFYRN